MFATLLGALPRPTLEGGDRPPSLDALVAAAVEAQEAAGLEPITDGRLRWRGFAGPLSPLADAAPLGAPAAWTAPLSVEAWRFAAAATTRAVKQALPGPYSLGRRIGGGVADPERPARTMALAGVVRSEVLALAAAGCPLVEIEERDAHEIGSDDAERGLFREAHQALTDGLAGIHLSLAIVGGNADTAGADTILGAPYASLAVDLIAGPDNWRLVRAAPGERGIVAGALTARDASDPGNELLLWAAGYAASSNGRGRDRVGLATSGSLGGLPWDVAQAKLRRLGEAAWLASLPAAQASQHLDPRAVDIRSAAAGRYVPPTECPRRRGRRRA